MTVHLLLPNRLQAETKDKTRTNATANTSSSLDSTTEHPRALTEKRHSLEAFDSSDCVTSAKQKNPKSVNAEDHHDNIDQSKQPEIPLHHRPRMPKLV